MNCKLSISLLDKNRAISETIVASYSGGRESDGIVLLCEGKLRYRGLEAAVLRKPPISGLSRSSSDKLPPALITRRGHVPTSSRHSPGRLFVYMNFTSQLAEPDELYEPRVRSTCGRDLHARAPRAEFSYVAELLYLPNAFPFAYILAGQLFYLRQNSKPISVDGSDLSSPTVVSPPRSPIVYV